jgi:hypothetical protein
VITPQSYTSVRFRRLFCRETPGEIWALREVTTKEPIMDDDMELEKIIRDIFGQSLSETTALVLLHILNAYEIHLTHPDYPETGFIREHTQRHAAEIISSFSVEGHPAKQTYADWLWFYNMTIPNGNFYEMPKLYQPEIDRVIEKLSQHPGILKIE